MAWHPDCVRVDSPNFGYPRGIHGQLAANIKASGGGGEFWHSMVGSLSGAVARFLNPAEEASAHFLFPKAGRPTQMVDAASAAWHAGGTLKDDPLAGGPGLGTVANLYFHGFEFEGGPIGNVSEPLTENQIEWGLRITRWLRDTYGGRRVYVLRETLWEHNWVYPTGCPSGRIPWQRVIAGLEEGEMLTQDQANQLAQLVKDMGELKKVLGFGTDYADTLTAWTNRVSRRERDVLAAAAEAFAARMRQ